MENLQEGLKQNATAFFVKHMVAFVFNLQKDNFRNDFVVTAFILEVKKRWFFITAAHTIKYVNEYIQNGYVLNSTEVIDFFHYDAKDFNPIPFPGCIQNAVLLDQIDDDVDLAIIHVPPLIQGLLMANNIQSLDKTAWSAVPKNPEALWLFGVPSELIQKGEGNIIMRPIGLHVYPEKKKPKDFVVRKYPRFYGKVILPDNVTSLKGMSGGPLLAFFDHKYWVVAVQSSWWPNSKFIEAIPIQFLCDGISKFLKSG